MPCACRCIPIRVNSTQAGVDGIEVLLISSSGGKGLVFPKVPALLPASCVLAALRLLSQLTLQLLMACRLRAACSVALCCAWMPAC